MRKNRILAFGLAFLSGITNINAQFSKPETDVEGIETGKKHEIQTAPLQGVISLVDAPTYYNPVLVRTGIHHPGPKNTDSAFDKSQLIPYKEDTENALNKMDSDTPTIFRNYSGLTDTKFTPPDNTIAVSNLGYVVSAMNSNFRLFRNTGSLIKTNSFADILRPSFPEFNATYYDPRVVYDSGSDKFIMVVLHGNTSDSTRIMIFFSKTNNPQDGWHFYALDGDIFKNGLWTDYPNIAVTKNELFITGNLYNDFGAFEEPFILQINKHTGYFGNPLQYQSWGDIKNEDDVRAFTLVPVGYGLQGTYGPGIYLVSNNSGNSNYANLYEITNEIGASNEKLTRKKITYPFFYAVPQYSDQKGSTELLNAGDNRIKQGFFLDNTIHYVYTSLNSGSNSSIVYCRVNITNATADFRSLGLTGTNYNYPSIASLATDSKNKSVLIGFLASSFSLFPEMRVVHCDDNFEFSSSVLVQAGNSSVNAISDGDGVERWGDYTGMARKYSTTACLFSGAYGNNNNWVTRIAEIGLNSNKTGLTEIKNSEINTQLYPNPVLDEYAVSFETTESSHIQISLYDMQGKLVETLYSGTERAGQKHFSFNRAALPAGLYTLYIRSDKNTLAVKKLSVQ